MRSQLLAFTALAVLAAAPAFAQTSYYAAPPQRVVRASPGKVVTGPPSLPSVEPLSRTATNIDSSDVRNIISPALPQPPVNQNAGPAAFLQAAQNALAENRTGAAQAALEDAETAFLTRSVPQGQVNEPDQSPAVLNINAALHALAAHDNAQAMNLIQQTMPMTNQMAAANQ